MKRLALSVQNLQCAHKHAHAPWEETGCPEASLSHSLNSRCWKRSLLIRTRDVSQKIGKLCLKPHCHGPEPLSRAMPHSAGHELSHNSSALTMPPTRHRHHFNVIYFNNMEIMLIQPVLDYKRSTLLFCYYPLFHDIQLWSCPIAAAPQRARERQKWCHASPETWPTKLHPLTPTRLTQKHQCVEGNIVRLMTKVS
jgi:hypothetical protein